MVRQKNRYIVVKIKPENELKALLRLKDPQLSKCILQNVKKYYGDYGLGITERGFRVKYCNERTKIAIIRCAHHAYQYVASILPLITLIVDVKAKFQILYVGATIVHCEKFIVRHQQRYLDQMIGQVSSAKERKDLITRVMEFQLD